MNSLKISQIFEAAQNFCIFLPPHLKNGLPRELGFEVKSLGCLGQPSKVILDNLFSQISLKKILHRGKKIEKPEISNEDRNQ